MTYNFLKNHRNFIDSFSLNWSHRRPNPKPHSPQPHKCPVFVTDRCVAARAVSQPRLLLSLFVALVSAIRHWRRSFTWSGDSGTNQLWSNGANWAGTAPTSNAATDLIFAGTTNTGTAGTPLNQNIATPMTLNSITFNDTAGNFFLGGGQIHVQSECDGHNPKLFRTLKASQTQLILEHKDRSSTDRCRNWRCNAFRSHYSSVGQRIKCSNLSTSSSGISSSTGSGLSSSQVSGADLRCQHLYRWRRPLAREHFSLTIPPAREPGLVL